MGNLFFSEKSAMDGGILTQAIKDDRTY